MSICSVIEQMKKGWRGGWRLTNVAVKLAGRCWSLDNKDMPKWLDFEKLIARIYQTISPEAMVKHDDSIEGRDSGIERQVDVSIRFREAGCDFLIIVQAKDYSNPADINAVGEFASVIKDVGASKGVLICNAGFTNGAQRLAPSLGIDLCSAHDSEIKNWRTVLTIPVCWERLIPNVSFQLNVYLEAGDSMSEDPTKWILTEDEGETKLDLIGTFVRKWNTNEIPKDPGRIHNLIPTNEKVELLVGSNTWRPVEELRCVYVVQRNLYRKDVQTEEFTGLRNCLTQDIEIARLGVPLPPLDHTKGWHSVDGSLEDLVAKERIILTVEGPVLRPTGFTGGGFSAQLLKK